MSEDVLTLWFDRENTLWVGTSDAGLSHFDLQRNTWRHYRHDPGDPASLSHNSVYAFYEDSVGRVWVGTAGGLNLLDRETGRCTRYMQQDGLPSDTIVGILEEIAPGEAGGYLWLSTLNGLSRFNPRAETFRNYDRSDGLINDAYYYFSYHRTQEGKLWFGGKNGIDIVDPSQITENAYVPPVVLTDFEINNQSVPIGGDSVLSQSITTLDALTLSHLDRVLSFEFAALNYVNPAKNRYAYKLEGFDEDWVETTSERRRATYTNLDHGNYIFRVRASNNDGVWNDEGVSLALTITPAWWETWWFYTLCGFGVLGVFGLVYWNKVNQLRRERALATSLREKEERFRAVWETSADAMVLSDPDGIVLAANLAYLHLYGYTAEDVVGNTFAIIFQEEQRPWAMEQYRSTFAAPDIPPAFESTIRRSDGTTRIVESRVGFLSKDGQRYAMLSSIRDITDRKRAEENLQRMNERLALATRAAHLGVWDWDIQKNELIWDDRMYELYGVKQEDFSGAYEAWLQGIHPDDRAASNRVSEQARRGERDYDTEFRIVRPDGDIRWLRAYAQVMWDEAGNPLRMTGINYDITERKQAEDSLKASLAEKNVLIRELYHRTKNTLQVIHSMLVLQAASMPDNAQVQKLVQDMENRIMTIALVHKKLYQVQDLSRLNISEYLQELAHLILQNCRASFGQISLTFDIEAIPMLFDVVIPCGLIVNELLSNAVRYAFPGEREGEIAIKLFRNENGKLELHVADNGVGVPPGFDFRHQDTLGLQSVVALAEHQMQGSIRFTGDNGVKCVVEFPDNLYTERV
jgi:PAS domain S-box-containing protein